MSEMKQYFEDLDDLRTKRQEAVLAMATAKQEVETYDGEIDELLQNMARRIKGNMGNDTDIKNLGDYLQDLMLRAACL